MTMTEAQKRTQDEWKKQNVRHTSIAWFPKESELHEWVITHGGSTYLKQLVSQDRERALAAGEDESLTSDGWHHVRGVDGEYYVDDGMVTRATVGEGQHMLPAYIYRHGPDAAMSQVEYPRPAREVVSNLMNGTWCLH